MEAVSAARAPAPATNINATAQMVNFDFFIGFSSHLLGVHFPMGINAF
jgi:hypothetical protein